MAVHSTISQPRSRPQLPGAASGSTMLALVLVLVPASGEVFAAEPASRLTPSVLRDPSQPDRLRLAPAGSTVTSYMPLPHQYQPGRPLGADPLWDLDPCGTCGPVLGGGRLWARGEYLLWWTRGTRLPPLVTTSPDGTPETTAGVLPAATILFGDEHVLERARPGGRVRLGWWLDAGENMGVEASYLGLADRSANFFASSPETPILARPFFDLQSAAQDSLLVAYPGFLAGSIAVELETSLHAFDVAWRHVLYRDCQRRADILVGYRYGSLQEDLEISHDARFTAPRGQILPGTTQRIVDRFDASNVFHGGHVGVVYQMDANCWTWELMLRIGLGNTASRVDIDGRTITTVPIADPPTAEFQGGLLAQPTNMGRFERDHFSVLPEVGVNVGYNLTHQLRATAGYSFLAWTRVMRPADQLDLNVSQLPPEDPPVSPPLGPQVPFTTSTFWAQGLQFGVEYRW